HGPTRPGRVPLHRDLVLPGRRTRVPGGAGRLRAPNRRTRRLHGRCAMTTDPLLAECHQAARDSGLAAGLALLCAKLLPGILPLGQAGTAVLPADLGISTPGGYESVRTVRSHGLTPRSWNFPGGPNRSVIGAVHGADGKGNNQPHPPAHPNTPHNPSEP